MRRLLFRAYAALQPRLGRLGLNLGLHNRFYRLSRRWLDPKRVELDGFHLYLDPEDDVLSYNLARTGVWEPSETELFRSLLREGIDVLDVGAHIGFHTVLAARAVGPQGRVFAFEPAPRNVALLRKNVESNGCDNVQVIAQAAGDRNGTVELHLHPKNTGGHSLLPHDATGGKTVTVPQLRLDDWIEAERVRPRVVKIDVEGGEQAVLDGMRNWLSRGEPLSLQMEFFPERLALHGPAREVLDRLSAHGFDLRIIEESGPGAALPVDRLLEEVGQRRLVNLLCRRGVESDSP